MSKSQKSFKVDQSCSSFGLFFGVFFNKIFLKFEGEYIYFDLVDDERIKDVMESVYPWEGGEQAECICLGVVRKGEVIPF